MRLIVLLLSLLGLPSAHAALAVTNVGQSNDFDVPVQYLAWMATAFVAGEDWTLTSIDLLMDNATTGNGGFVLELWSDSANNPGASLLSLTGPANPATQGIHSYTTSGFALSQSATYWVIAGVDQDNGSQYVWPHTSTFAVDPASRPGWSIPGNRVSTSGDQGGTWGSLANGAMKFTINGTPLAPAAVPAPVTGALLLFGLAAMGAGRRGSRA